MVCNIDNLNIVLSFHPIVQSLEMTVHFIILMSKESSWYVDKLSPQGEASWYLVKTSERKEK